MGSGGCKGGLKGLLGVWAVGVLELGPDGEQGDATGSRGDAEEVLEIQRGFGGPGGLWGPGGWRGGGLEGLIGVWGRGSHL